jgi:FecR-like protein
MGEPLDDIVHEARDHFGKREAGSVDWDAVDSALFARIEQEARARRSQTQARRRPGALGVVLVLSTAAAIGFLVVRGLRDAPIQTHAPAVAVESPGESVSMAGDGQALVSGVAVTGEARLRLGDVVETRGASVTLERPGKVSMILEAGSRVRVTKVDQTLVLDLERGAVEARVTPVAHGEAFAVDIEGSRVAVHGTHLRVQRNDWRVIVDVNEGVIAVGATPPAGMVLGAVVVAPAHAEFMAFDALETLQVNRDPSSLRWSTPGAPTAAPGTTTSEPHAPAGAASVRALSVPAGERAEGRAPSAPMAAVSAAPATEPDLASTVRKCMAERPRAENVTVLVKTTLHLALGDDGWVQSARFEPPVAPDVNACAAQSIYRTHFDHGGTITVPVDFKN